MEIKNIKLSLLVLLSLMLLSYAFLSIAQDASSTQNNIFSDSDQDGLSDEEEKIYGTDPQIADTDHDGYSDGAEVSSGYDPLKPAPGDKLVAENKTVSTENSSTADSGEKNLTKELAQKVYTITASSDPDNQDVTLEEVQNMVNESLSPDVVAQGLPEISRDSIKIKKQNYAGLSQAQIKEKKKQDFEKYIIGIYYILSSNSPRPITSGADLSTALTSIVNDMTTSLSTQNSSSIEDLSQSGEKILEQLKDVEVPEDLVDIHIQALQFANYSLTLKNAMNPSLDDPVGDLANLSKIQSFIESLMSFSSEAEAKMTEYGINYDDIKVDLSSVGLPDLNQLEASDAATQTQNSNDATQN